MPDSKAGKVKVVNIRNIMCVHMKSFHLAVCEIENIVIFRFTSKKGHGTSRERQVFFNQEVTKQIE